MIERPILFSAQMVQALLDGSKTQTRRVVKPEGAHHLFQFRGTTAAAGADEPTGEWAWCGSSHVVNKHIRCPYGKPGDRLWVRENWFQLGRWRIPDHPETETDDAFWDGTNKVAYAACTNRPSNDWRSRPSIHMPRWASRITLEVTGVRVERLQDISEQDAWAEGCKGYDDDVTGGKSGYQEYAELWEQINGQGSWNANPWVWVIEFKRVKP